jgi:hypothetical protein
MEYVESPLTHSCSILLCDSYYAARHRATACIATGNSNDSSDCASLSDVFTFSSSFSFILRFFYLLVEGVQGNIFAPDHTQ